MQVIQSSNSDTHNQGNSEPPLRVAFISDVHFNQDHSSRVPFPGNNYVPAKRTELVWSSLVYSSPDMTFSPGDLVDQDSVESYTPLDKMIDSFQPNIPFYSTPGNHDRTKALFDDINIGVRVEICTEQGKHHYVVRRGRNHFIFVDSSPIEKGIGSVGHVGFEWLSGVLDNVKTAEHAWIITHFPPVLFSELLPARSKMVDGDRFHRLMVDRLAVVKGVFYGHVHNRRMHTVEGVSYHSIAPSSVALTSDGNGGRIEDTNASIGFELLTFHNSGHLEREMVPVDVSESVVPPTPDLDSLT